MARPFFFFFTSNISPLVYHSDVHVVGHPDLRDLVGVALVVRIIDPDDVVASTPTP